MPASVKPLLYYFGTENSSFFFLNAADQKEGILLEYKERNIFTP